MNTQATRTFTTNQNPIVDELCQTHGLDPSQISFDGDALTPIFDYEAACALSLKLTDIQSIDSWITADRTAIETGVINTTVTRSTARCTVTLPDGRNRTVEDSATIGERISPDHTIETSRDADSMAQNRAVRRGIRSVGINLWKAHRTFMETGEVTGGNAEHDRRTALYREIHALAREIGYSDDEYREIIKTGYDGRSSITELTDKELDNLGVLFRSLRNIQRSRENGAAHKHAA